MAKLSSSQQVAFITSNKLNVAQASTALQMAGVTREERKRILAEAGLLKSTSAQIAANGGLTVSLKSITASLIAQAKAWAMTPFGMATIAVAGIFAVAKAFEYLASADERAIEKHQELSSVFEQTTSEIQSLEGELATSKERLEELSAIEAPTYVEEAEIQKLETSIPLLEKELELLRQRATYEDRAVANAANDALTAKSLYSTGGTTNTDTGLFLPEFGWRDIIEEAAAYQDELHGVEESLSSAYDKLAEFEPGTAAYEAYEKHINQLEQRRDSLGQTVTDLETQILELYKDLLNPDGTVKSGFENTAGRVQVLLGIEVDEATFDNAKSTAGKTAEEITKEIQDVLIPLVPKDYEQYDEGTMAHFRTLEAYTNKVEEYKNLLNSLSADELEHVYDLVINQGVTSWDEITAAVIKYRREAAHTFEEIKTSAAEAAETNKNLLSSITDVQGMLDSQGTGTSISVDDFSTAALNGYSDALEYNNGTLQLNAEKVNELIKAKAEEQIAHNDTAKAIAQSEYLENAAEIKRLREQLAGLGDDEEGLRAEINANIDSLLAENNSLKTICSQYDVMSASLREATSAYQHWLNAQGASQTGDMFDSALSAIQHINDTLNNTESDMYGRIGRSDYQAAIDFIIPDTVDAEDTAAVNSYLESINDMFTYDSDGNRTGLNIANFCQQAVDAGLMVLNEAGTAYEIAGGKTMEDFANGLELSLPLVQAMFGELQEFGAEFDWADEANKTIGDLAVTATEAAEALRGIEGNETLKLNIDVSDIENKDEKIDALKATIEEMQNLKVKPGVDSSEIEYANQIIEYCLAQKQLLTAPDVMKVDTSVVEGALGNAITLMQEFISLQGQIEMSKALDIDTSSAEAELASVASAIQELDPNVAMALQIDTTSIQTISESIAALDAEVIVKAGVDESAVIGFQQAEHDAEGTVTWGNDTSEVDAYSTATKYAQGVVNWGNNTSNVRTHFTASGTVNWSNGGSQGVNGTAHLTGTARASGDWGTAPGGETLVGELGTEIVVDPHTGRWYTVGDTGAEFVDIPKNAIIFNHKQSESLLKYGYVAGRGDAMVSGTAMVSGSVPITGMWGNGNGSSGGNYGGSGNYHENQNNNSESDIAEDAKNAFEEAYKYHQHLLAMEQEDLEHYLRWLEEAYQDAYRNGEIELEDYYKYEEEVYEGRKELFQDYLNDLEFKIAGLERLDGTEGQIINLYLGMIKDIKTEIALARARGLDENDEYIQELLEQQRDYEDEIADIREDATDDAKGAVEDLIEYRIKMLKQDLENERDALEDKKDALKDFYDEQKDLLQQAYDDEKTLEERNEKRKAKTDIEAELDQLKFDDSAWAQKRKLELQEELSVAQKDLDDFEKEQALDNTQNLLDAIYEKQAAQIDAEIEAIEAQLNDPEALYNQALRDIQNNTQALYLEMVEYNAKYGDGNAETVKTMWDEAKASLDDFLDTFGRAYKDIILVASPGSSSSEGYATGTRSAAPGVKKVDEKGAEWLFTSGDGTKYRVFSGGEMVLNAEATKFLYDFAMDRGNALSNMFASLLNAVNLTSVGRQSQPIQLSTGDIIIQGNADQQTVSEIRRAQREGIDYILKQFTRLNK